MKSNMILIILLLTFPLLSFSEQNVNKYQRMAGQILTQDWYHGFDCKTRVRWLAKRILRETDDFYVVIGKYKGKGHIWIEMSGIIIDPSVYDSDVKHYKKRIKVEGKTFDWTSSGFIFKTKTLRSGGKPNERRTIRNVFRDK